MGGNEINDRGADDHPVRDTGDGGGLFGRADAEANRNGQVGRRLERCHRGVDRGLLRLLQPGDAGDRDVIEEAARAIDAAIMGKEQQ